MNSLQSGGTLLAI